MIQPPRLALVALAAAVLAPASSAQCEDGTLFPAVQYTSQLFGDAVALSGNRALVGARRQLDPATGALDGAAYVFERIGGQLVQVYEAKPSDPSPFGEFGFSVAIDGNVAVVGHPGSDILCPGQFFCRSGAAEVFERGPAGWAHAAILTPQDFAPSDEVGWSVAVDEGRILVGARRGDDACTADPLCDSGAAYLFTREAAGWREDAKLVASSAAPGDFFGASVDLLGDLAVVGAPAEYAGAPGRVLVFEHDGSSWVEVQELSAFDGHPGDGYGLALSLGPGALLVGAPTHAGGGVERGAAYLYEHGGDGFVLRARLSDPQAENHDFFGRSVALARSARTPTALVGAPNKDVEPLAEEGVVFLYERTPSGAWHVRSTIQSSAGAFGDEFGKALAVAGTRALIGNYLDDAAPFNNSGVVRAYDLPGGVGLTTCQETLSVSQGGSQTLSIYATPKHAGAIYLTLGSTSGTSPGLPVPGSALVLPLVRDAYTDYTLANPNTALLASSLGFLGPNGEAQAVLSLPKDSDPLLAGLVVHHAYVVIGPQLVPVMASNPSTLYLVP